MKTELSRELIDCVQIKKKKKKKYYFVLFRKKNHLAVYGISSHATCRKSSELRMHVDP